MAHIIWSDSMSVTRYRAEVVRLLNKHGHSVLSRYVEGWSDEMIKRLGDHQPPVTAAQALIGTERPKPSEED